ncbi:MAG TPA: hypothetical protein VMA95_08880 [Streptosporangiaceae bacterium]|nr:hypothetical protein [Streptosporangiaceae bacterium]
MRKSLEENGMHRTARLSFAALIAGTVVLAAGCGSASNSTGSAPKVTACGSAKTAANVPVHIEVAKGNVRCATALAIENQYAKAIRSGKEPGNGGGGPVKVNGWTCQGYATPVVLNTGKASKCTEDGNEILAILPSTT